MSASTAVWGTCDTHGAVAVVLVDEEACREKAPGRRSKAVRRISIALFFCEKFVYVVLLEFCFDGEVGKTSNCGVKIRSQYCEINCSPEQRLFDVNLKAKGGLPNLLYCMKQSCIL